MGPNIVSYIFLYIRIRTKYRFLHLKSYFDIQNWSKYHFSNIFYIRIETKYHFFAFKIMFWHSKLDQISSFVHFWYIRIGTKYRFLHLKFYFDIQNWSNYHFLNIFYIQMGTKYRLFTFKIIFWHSKWTKYCLSYFCYPNWDQITLFNIYNTILMFKVGPNITFRMHGTM